ncbi:GNAT family N-acetyltransferase [Bradyrhizobium iriomotense]|uniref:GNAT family N-acetyltransferase n=1 Tax=Bradyrhizobium iriomotense TaxID=441950 RepID=UPI001B8A2979|nr:GNAT family N-acetyltransferase [Bradyrhizobium iriomotense]MBR1133267.1 GNAT family N-acetyltransferase [Bradyrhizobium iriomotense]
MTVILEVLHLKPDHTLLLTELFSRIAADPLSNRFHPHPFTATEADRICHYGGRDRYLALRIDDQLSAYCMLRGWDEGFSVPSLGIYVAPELRGSGAARLMMQHLHLTARLSGAERIRLKVYADNLSAYKLYASLGYCFSDPADNTGQLVGIFDLSRSALMRSGTVTGRDGCSSVHTLLSESAVEDDPSSANRL